MRACRYGRRYEWGKRVINAPSWRPAAGPAADAGGTKWLYALETDQPLQTSTFWSRPYVNADHRVYTHPHELTRIIAKNWSACTGLQQHKWSDLLFSEGKGALSNKKSGAWNTNDVRGYMPNFWEKAIERELLTWTWPKEDSQKVVEYLRAEGGLTLINYTRHRTGGIYWTPRRRR